MLVAVFALAALPAAAVEDEDLAAVRKAIAAQNAKYAAAVTKQDLKAFLSLFTDDAVLVQFDRTVKGKKEREEAGKAQLAAVTEPDLKTEEVELRGGLAYEKGVYTVKSRKGGAKSGGSYLVIWTKQTAGWKFLAEITMPPK